MALIFMDGFDAGDFAQKWSNYSSAPSVSATGSRYGAGRYLILNNTPETISKVFTGASKVIIGFALKLDNLASGISFLTFRADSASVVHVLIVVTSAGAIQICRGTEATVLAVSANGLISPDAWNYVEVSATVHDTTGNVEVRLNGTSVVTFTGDTRNAGTSMLIDSIALKAINSGTTDFDDVYMLNDTGPAPYNAFLGDVRITTLVPNGAGSDTGFAPSAGANYTTVDELPFSAADYVSATVSGTRDLYTMSDLSGSYSVLAVQNNIIAKKSDAGGTAIKPTIKSGGAVYYGSNGTLSSSDVTYTDLRTTDPATSTAWTIAGLNNLEAGVEVA